MVRAVVHQKTYILEDHTTLRELAEKVQEPGEPRILLAYADGKLRELFHPIEKDCYVRFVTLKEQAGYMTYKRTAMFMFLKACEDVLGQGAADDISIKYSIGNSTFCEFLVKDIRANMQLALKIQERMEQLRDQNLPIRNTPSIPPRQENILKASDYGRSSDYFVSGGDPKQICMNWMDLKTTFTDIWRLPPVMWKTF